MLRVRVKRNRTKQASVAAQVVSTKSATNLELGNLTSRRSKDEQIDQFSRVGENVASSSTSQERDGNVNSVRLRVADGAEKKCAVVDIKDLRNVDKNPSDEENKMSFTFDKYENLSKDTDYALPYLKVLGRVDTEFRFTSRYIDYYNFTYFSLASQKWYFCA